ncbi:MAG: acyl-CoA dehydrogenase family protein, partial [Deltaproteobacteria bacterium]|nr:acyl-CoA dehydrogenase family protein [Deltaproteobacteria bacterium]
MDFALSQADREVVDLVKRLAQTELAPRAAAVDAGQFPLEGLKILAQHGLMGIKVAKNLGGLGAGLVAHVSAIRELAAVCPSTAVTLAVTNMVADMIEKFGTDEQKARYLPPIFDGTYPAASFALSETGAGSDAASLRTRAVKVDGGWQITGSKMWITSGDRAGVVLVMAKTDPDKGARGITAFLVEPGTPGFEVGRHEEKLGLRGSSTVSLHFAEMFVPDSAQLGNLGQGFEVAMVALDGGRCGIGAQALGMGYAVLAETAKALNQRAALDKQLGLDQNAQFRLADMATKLDAAWLLVLRAAWLRDAGKKMTREAAMAKVMATEAGDAACKIALQILGPAALDARHPVARALRDVRVSRIYEGTRELQRMVVA